MYKSHKKKSFNSFLHNPQAILSEFTTATLPRNDLGTLPRSVPGILSGVFFFRNASTDHFWIILKTPPKVLSRTPDFSGHSWKGCFGTFSRTSRKILPKKISESSSKDSFGNFSDVLSRVTAKKKFLRNSFELLFWEFFPHSKKNMDKI